MHMVISRVGTKRLLLRGYLQNGPRGRCRNPASMLALSIPDRLDRQQTQHFQNTAATVNLLEGGI